jgi:V/A-type H+-transporting ATPase subunit G/H
MDEDPLRRLLTAERQAEELVSVAERERDELLRLARQHVAKLEGEFQAELPGLRERLAAVARQKADEELSVLSRRYTERRAELREMAEQRSGRALEAALRRFVEGGG